MARLMEAETMTCHISDCQSIQHSTEWFHTTFLSNKQINRELSLRDDVLPVWPVTAGIITP